MSSRPTSSKQGTANSRLASSSVQKKPSKSSAPINKMNNIRPWNPVAYPKVDDKFREDTKHLSHVQIQSFNWIFPSPFEQESAAEKEAKLSRQMLKLLPKMKIVSQDLQYVFELSWSDLNIHKPTTQFLKDKLVTVPLYPHMCRESASTYEALLTGVIELNIYKMKEENTRADLQRPEDLEYFTAVAPQTTGDEERENYILLESCYEKVATEHISKSLGNIPIMLRSNCCHLRNATEQELVQHFEEPYDAGGYFINSGTERLIRTVVAQKRNTPLAIYRDSWVTNFANATNMGIIYRGVRPDESSALNTMHYLKDGTIALTLSSRANRFVLFPIALVLKALKHNCTDRELFERLLQGSTKSTDIQKVENCIRKVAHITSQEQALKIIGAKFAMQSRQMLSKDKFIYLSDPLTQAKLILSEFFLCNLGTNLEDKYDMVIYMFQKLLKFVNGEVQADDIDSTHNHEIYPSGTAYANALKASLIHDLESHKTNLSVKWLYAPSKRSSITTATTLQEIVAQAKAHLATDPKRVKVIVTRLLTTGTAPVNLEFPQYTGLSIIAEKINYYRFSAHFVAIHRGAAFEALKTSDVRRFRVEAWGFLCPAQSPDGSPCGLLNHLTRVCRMSYKQNSVDETKLIPLLVSLGMSLSKIHNENYSAVLLDGKVIGSVSNDDLSHFGEKLRCIKASDDNSIIPNDLEIAVIPARKDIDLKIVPGIIMNSHVSRFTRPVLNLLTNHVEYVSPIEQLFLNISCMEHDFKKGITTHRELDPMNMFSHIGTLTPFSDFNQSPRNIYQCHMSKQSLANSNLNYKYRTDNKIYRLQTPQVPASQTVFQNDLPYNDYANGTNAIIAVLSYTGYDMEDAMIVNKSSYDRGLAHGTIYKTEVIDLNPDTGRKRGVSRADKKIYFKNVKLLPDGTQEVIEPALTPDGLPEIGYVVEEDSPMAVSYNESSDSFSVIKYKYAEKAVIENVRVIGENLSSPTKVLITLRYRRNPVIGDKFSSRHGQKGIMSVLWPQEDLPFTESGMTPDVIINPHAFPSRMTIGMLVEIMASKSASLHGFLADATPFQFSEQDTAVDFYGKLLAKAGYNYYGNEILYNPHTGQEMKAEIFFGVVYYQRLRHMVSDKYQVRAHGPVDKVTRQPVKGRKRGGGVRFGEMERDGLLAYGASFLVRDRLFHCSDEDTAIVCNKCKQLLSVTPLRSGQQDDYFCKKCGTNRYLQPVEIPYVLRYLMNELATVNINLEMSLGEA